ncbi:MAG: divalent-cation tolerance protein CutA [Actinomycetota bacterium]
MNQGAVVIMTTVPGAEEAARLADHLIGERLAACVQEVPITSRYRWEGEICREPEILLLFKTAADRAAAAAACLEGAHPYEVPEVLVLETAGGGLPYLSWLTAETRPGPGRG